MSARAVRARVASPKLHGTRWHHQMRNQSRQSWPSASRECRAAGMRTEKQHEIILVDARDGRRCTRTRAGAARKDLAIAKPCEVEAHNPEPMSPTLASGLDLVVCAWCDPRRQVAVSSSDVARTLATRHITPGSFCRNVPLSELHPRRWH